MSNHGQIFRLMMVLAIFQAVHALAQAVMGFGAAVRLNDKGMFRVPVTLACETPVAGLQFEIYDSQGALHLDSVRTTANPTSFTVRWSEKKIILYAADGGSLHTGDHSILELFIHLDPGAAGFDSLSFRPLPVLGNPAGERILPVELQSIRLDLRNSTAVADATDLRPAMFALYPVYPNPFNESATLSFELRERGQVDIVLFDIRGYIVRSIVDEVRDAGTHRVNLPARGLSSGIYWCRLQANGVQRIQKVIVLR